MSILYRYGSTYYINMTNRCPCRCVFCVRNQTPRLGDADSLWLEREPTVDEILAEVGKADLSDSGEIVFCGYGEPTERFGDLVEAARRIREEHGLRIRVDTNGLGSLLNGRDIVPELASVADSVSVSLNAPDEEEYLEVTRSRFGPGSHAAVLDFVRGCRDAGMDVTVSVVGGYIDSDSAERCRDIARGMGVRFRVR